FWEETAPHAFTREDLREQLELQLKRCDLVTFAKTKIERIEEQDGLKRATLKVLRWMRGTLDTGENVETKVYFRLWLVNNKGWKIQREALIDGTTVRGCGRGFTEVTKAAGIDFIARRNLLLKDPTWEPKKFAIAKFADGGVSVVDYDGDGW